MRILKIVLSVFALLIAGAQYALTAGLWNLHPGAIAVIGAVASFFFALGITPIPVPPRLAQILGAGAGLLATIVAVHAGNVSRGDNPHPWAWATVTAIGVLMGAVGRLQFSPTKPAPPAPGTP